MPIDLAANINPKTRLILVNSPSNPLAPFSINRFMEICDLAEDHNLFVISDEIYEKIIYDHAFSIGSLPGKEDRTVTSKWVFQGLRHDGLASGNLTGPRETMKWVNRLLLTPSPRPLLFGSAPELQQFKDPQEEVFPW